MKAAWTLGRRLSAGVLVVALLLVAVLAWEWEQGRRLERDFKKMRILPSTAVPAINILPEFTLPDIANGYPELLARPIFVVSRRPLAAANQGVAGAMKKGQFALVGVVITPTLRAALLRDAATGKTERVEQGAQTRGMTLEDVQANAATLRQGTESEELTLKVQVGVKPPSPAMPMPGGMPNPMFGSPQPMPQPVPMPMTGQTPPPGPAHSAAGALQAARNAQAQAPAPAPAPAPVPTWEPVGPSSGPLPPAFSAGARAGKK